MDKYGQAAVRATTLVAAGKCGSAPEAWEVAMRELFPGKPASQEKSCPKGAFLGLCEKGLVAGVPPGSYTRSRENMGYAVDAVALLRREPALADAGATALWKRVTRGESKQANSQMDVVLALWAGGLIVRDSHR